MTLLSKMSYSEQSTFRKYFTIIMISLHNLLSRLVSMKSWGGKT